MPVQQAESTSPEMRTKRVEFTLDQFNNELNNHGYLTRWTKATLCPNRDKLQDDHHIVNCSLCDTNGFVYYDPREIKALVTSYGTKQLFMPESRYEPGTAYFTTLPEYKLSFWDKIELLTAKSRYTEVKAKQTTLTYKLKYPVLSVQHVLSNLGTSIALSNVTLNNDGTITLKVQPEGDFLSFSYFYHPTYIMIDLLHQVRDSRMTVLNKDKEVDFPTQAVGRLDFLVRDEAAT